MGYNNREIERKYLVPNATLDSAVQGVKTALPKWIREIKGASADIYWKAPNGVKADFIRVRYMPEGGGVLTLKFTDKGGIFNRVEIDVPVDDPDQAVAFWTHAAGKPTARIFKTYIVYFLDKTEHTTVSVYQVKGDKRIFVEVEALSEKRVTELQKQVSGHLVLIKQNKSLYQLFGKKNGRRKQKTIRRKYKA